jgi:hypothetical protein
MGILLERVGSSEGHGTNATGRYWVSFAKSPGAATPVFDVFVARAGSKVPFRTLVWTAVLEPDSQLYCLVDTCVRELVSDSGFSSLALKGESGLILLELASESEGGSTGSHSGQQLRDWTRVRDVDFFRLDYPASEGIAGFSCRALGLEGRYELTALLEQPYSFSRKMLNWALERHEVSELRNPSSVNTDSLTQFLNHGWVVPGDVPAAAAAR